MSDKPWISDDRIKRNEEDGLSLSNAISEQEKDRLGKFYDSLSQQQKMKLNEEFNQILRDEINKELIRELKKVDKD
jgi:hypothetical protein